jgi:hypothetical protein
VIDVIHRPVGKIKGLSSFVSFNGSMLLPSDFWRAAKYLIGRYGAEAGGRAGRRAVALRDQGDLNGHKTWGVLAATVAELQRSRHPAPDRGEPAPVMLSP